MTDRPVPDATVARLPLYLRALVALQDQDIATASSEDLARGAGVNPAKLRKDLSHLGSFGTRGVGYAVDELVVAISGVLGLTAERNMALVGLGNLGRALAAYGGFQDRGFRLAALLDADPALVGSTVDGRTVQDVDDLERVVDEGTVTMAVLAVPATAAQELTDRLVASGVTAILNFAPAHVEVPEHVTLRRVDLSVELQILSFYERAGALRSDLTA